MAALAARISGLLILGYYLSFALSNVAAAATGIVQFSPGTDYVYQYEGFTDITNVAVIKVSAKMGISLLSKENDFQHCRLKLYAYRMVVNSQNTDYDPDTLNMDMSKWVSFDMSPRGEITRVHYTHDEQMSIFTLKQILLGTLSSHLVVSSSQLDAGLTWAYQVNETGHEGTHLSTYQAEPSRDEIIFNKHRQAETPYNTDNKQTKVVHLNSAMQVLSKITVKESFAAPNQLSPSYKSRRSDVQEQLTNENNKIDLPKMGGWSTGTMVLLKADSNETIFQEQHEKPEKLLNCSLAVKEIPLQKVKLTHSVLTSVKGNVSCIADARKAELHHGLACFRKLLQLLMLLDVASLNHVASLYLTAQNVVTAEEQQSFVDALAATRTTEAYNVLRERVLKARKPEPELLMRLFIQLVDLPPESPPPQNFLTTLENVVFYMPYNFTDQVVTTEVNDRATLVIGSVARKLSVANADWSTGVIRRLEQRLGVHNPYHHRQLRSSMSEDDFNKHLMWKTLHLHSLGNAANPSSRPLIVSYLNTSDSHLVLRCSAADALSKFEGLEVAEMLLAVAMTDQEENVRLAAINGYKKHPHGGDIRVLLDPIYRRDHNLTKQEHQRMKRSLKDTVERIWQGFKFKLESPSLNWVKAIGGSKLGASMGLVIKNLLDIHISPLSGHLLVDVLDKAFATIHIGLIGFDLDIFRAEICFKGHIGYELNILKEYAFDSIKALADLYNNVVKKLISTITGAVKSFRDLISSYKNTDFNQIIDDLIDSIKQLPRKVLNLRRIGKRIYQAIGRFVELPPVVVRVKELTSKVSTLFNDIKTDVMNLYNAIADTVNTVIPWAWDEIVAAFKGIGKAIKNIIKNPKSSFQDIGKSVARISAAIAALIEAKNKIVDANFFAKENRPYWFDIKKEMKDIWDKVLAVKNSVKESIDWLKSDPSANAIAKRFTGVDLDTMKKLALSEIMQVVEEELAEPITHLKRLLEPFINTYNFFVDTIKAIKTAWRLLIEGYEKGRTILEQLFGRKMHAEFPRKYLESSSCGDGFFETNGKGHYEHSGIALDVAVGKEVIAPYGGKLTKTGSKKMTLKLEHKKNVLMYIGNIYVTHATGRVEAGDKIGTVARPGWCIDGHIHIAMRDERKNKTIDPSIYLRKRKMPKPQWIQECDHYLLVWLDDTIGQGSLMESKKEEDKTPEIDNAPSAGSLDVGSLETKSRKKRATKIFDKINDFAKRLGLPDLSKLKDLFSFNMNDLTLGKILDLLDKVGLTKLKNSIIKILNTVESLTNNESCMHPDSMDDQTLKTALIQRGKNAVGARQTLVNRYLESDPTCLGIGSRAGKNVYCRFNEACTRVSCCVDLKLFVFRHALAAFIAYDPCKYTVTFGINTWTHSMKVLSHDFAIEGTAQTVKSVKILNVVQLMAIYKVQREKDVLKVSLGVSFCSTRAEECQAQIAILSEAQIAIGPCDENATTSALTVPSNSPTVSKMLNMSISDVMKLIEASNVDEEVMIQLVEDLRDAFASWLRDQINAMVVKIFGNEFDLFDICTTGLQRSFGPYYIEIYRLNPPISIPVGPIILQFRFGIDGHYGATFGCTLCIMTMKATATVVPRIGSAVWGSVGVSFFVLSAELRLTGYLLTTSFPTKVIVEFNKFPLTLRSRMDLELIPLRIELRALLIFRFCIWIPWKGKKCWKKTLLNFLIWHYQTKAISKNIFNLNNAEADHSPPDFEWYGKAECKNCDEDDDKERKRRAVGGGGGCTIEQVAGRDYTEPAFLIELKVLDDRSEVKLTYCIGTSPMGCDVVRNEALSGGSSLFVKTMPIGVTLYCTVSATNSMGLTGHTTCQLDTYDMTLPHGRVSVDFRSTSHPNIISGSALALDDSPTHSKKVSIGYGREHYGNQLLDWQDVSGMKAIGTVHSSKAPLSHFSAGRDGRLIATPFKVSKYMYTEPCAQECISYPISKCLSFNYDSGPDGTCELLSNIEGDTVQLKMNGYFNHYERRGIGEITTVRFDNLNLKHGTLIYLNYYMQNTLGYENIISSKSLKVDFTTPEPGLIKNAKMDVTEDEDCHQFVPKLWQYRCQSEPSKANYRYIIDGEGSATVFNGHEPLVDDKYTRSNRMMTANWDGFHDYESGILVYTWAIGDSPCEDNVHPHTDPHAHLSMSEWTHSGTAFPLNLPDGKYHVSVRAINNIEFNPLALTVCHQLPFVIDNSPPFIHSIDNVQYDEDEYMITFEVNATDPESDIKQGEMGLGQSRRDTYLLDWTEVENFTVVTVKFKIKDGVPTWVKMRVSNNVDLRTVGHAEKPIIVDLSPPIAGDVYDGARVADDVKFQSSTSQLCSNWQGFHDPESGITKYMVGVGTKPNLDDVVPYLRLDYTSSSHCFEQLSLQHNAIYYSSVIAFNGGHVQKQNSSHSDGVTIDTTPPVKCWIKDGDTVGEDAKYTSDPATVAAHWGGCSDPESDLKDYKLTVYRTHKDVNKESLIHTEANISKHSSSVSMHHLHLLHGDFVQVDLTATNNADAGTSLRSDGLTVDLTDPILKKLVDGATLAQDMQYTDSTTELKASWEFLDEESGIDHYKVSAYELHAGRRLQIYPTTSLWKLVSGALMTWTSDEALSLKVGAQYCVRVSAVNGAGLTAVHETDCVIVDPTPPKMTYVHAGVLMGQSEELFDGYVLHNDENGIKASWAAVDAQSGIMEYMLAIGTTSGGSDVLAFQSRGVDKDGYISGLNLALTDKVTNKPVYYITVKAMNGAGKNSTIMTSSPIRMLRGDKAGVVKDGPSSDEDISWQWDTATSTQTFSGFESERDGISHYLWAVGSQPCWDDVLAFSPDALLITPPHASQLYGLGGGGKGQAILPLSPTHKYYSCVRAFTGAGNLLESSSDGFTIDVTAPNISFTSVGIHEINKTTSGVLYQREGDSYVAKWTADDAQSDVRQTSIQLGTFPDGKDVHAPSVVSNSYIANGELKPADAGLPNILTVQTVNRASLHSQLFSPALTVDKTPPGDGKVNCPKFVQGGDTIECSWHGFLETESQIDYYMFGVGQSEGDDSMFDFKQLASSVNKYKASGLKAGGLQHKHTYFVTVMAFNKVGLLTTAYSDSIVVDDTPPEGHLVIELPDVFVIDESATGPSNQNSSVQSDEDVVMKKDAICQRSLVQISVAWQKFTDPETTIIGYQVGLGTSAGGTQVRKFTDVVPGKQLVVIRGLDLSTIQRVFATVKAFNSAGLHSTATSNGVYISRISSGLPSNGKSVVYDGDKENDAVYQDHNDGLSAHWDLSGDPCPVASMQWAIHKFDGTIVMPMTVIPLGETRAIADELQLRNGESYFVVLRVTNQLGFTYTLHSDGVTIELEPLMPGNVRDGDVVGVDLNFHPSITSLSANWDGFGREKDNTDMTFNNNPNVDTEIGKHHEVEFYEVAAGTDRRYADLRENVHPFINVGLNTTWTFHDLKLVPKGTYYMTVRAHSVSAASVQVTSNGINVGYSSQVVSLGTVNLPEYTSSQSELSFSWGGFKFMLPVKYYRWGIGTASDALESLICEDFAADDAEETIKKSQYHHLLDLKPLTSAGTDTYISLSDLSLTDGATYFVVVIAIDESGVCTQASSLVTVDTSLPNDGQIYVGLDLNLPVLYSDSDEELSVSWTGFDDPHSGIDTLKISLLSAATCQDVNVTKMSTVAEADIATNSKNFTFINLQLKADVPYFIKLQITNGAKLVRTAVSSPIVLDLIAPIAGTVKDGRRFDADVNYQSTTSEVHGTLVYLPSSEGEGCPLRRYPMTSAHADWLAVVHQYLYDVLGGKQDKVAFMQKQLIYSDEGLSIAMRRDTKSEQMISGAVQTDSDILDGGVYEFELKAAGGNLRAVTSVTFYDGPVADVFADSTLTLFEHDTRSPADDGKRPGGVQIQQHVLEGDTSTIGRGGGVNETHSFGFQIHTSASKDGDNGDWLILWSTGPNETRQASAKLKFNASETFHTYVLSVIAEDSNDGQKYSELVLNVDGYELAALWGAHSVSESTKVVLGVYNRHGWVPPLADKYNPPETTAVFRNLKFPPAADVICRHGYLFRGGHNQIEKFDVSITNDVNGPPIIPFRTVARPCVACAKPCDAAVCDENCRLDAVQTISFSLQNLNLTSRFNGENDTQLLQPYYLIVKAITGSGRSITAWSDGIYIDETPPFIQTIFHVDMAWNSYEPSEFQGDNTTIAVYFEVSDEESGMGDTWWAIGTSPGAEDVQRFVVVDNENFAMNNSLLGLLLDEHTYYVTLVAYNSGGLKTSNSSSGVTIRLTSPNVSAVATETKDTKPISSDSKVDAVRSSRPDEVDVSWGDADDKQQIETNYFSVSSDNGKDDIVPRQLVGAGGHAGSVHLSNEGIKLGASNDSSNLSDIRPRNKREAISQFFMEPGRTLHVNLDACSAAHKCSLLPVKPIIVMRETDSVSKMKNGNLELRLKSDKYSQELIVTAPSGQEADTVLLGGILSDTDLRQEYKSDASNSFKPYIVQPSATMDKTDRYLRNRILSWDGPAFYLNTAPGQTVTGPLTLVVPFDKSKFTKMSEFQPKLLLWCAQEEMWIDAGRTCDDSEDNSKVDMSKGVLTVKVCYGASACSAAGNPIASNRRRRATPGSSGATSGAVGAVSNSLSNTAPSITTSSLSTTIFEDSAFSVQLEASDAESDQFTFSLDHTYQIRGSANITYGGILSYAPCTHCSGTDVVHFTVREVRTDNAEALFTNGEYTVTITPVNDNPRLLMLVQGADATPATLKASVTVEENQPGNVAYKDVVLLFAAMDPDASDTPEITFESAANGKASLYTAVTEIQLTAHDCTRTWSERQSVWDAVLAAVKNGDAKLVLPTPCDMELSEVQGFSWTVTALRYTPAQGFYGVDTVKLIANDQEQALSDQLTIEIAVLRNPCVNEGTCVGPADDPTCSSDKRKDGFTGYSCRCFDGYSGDWCQTNIDDCASAPCADNYTCVDLPGGYKCYCHPDWPCHRQGSGLLAWHIGLIAGAGGFVLLVFFVIVGCFVLRSRKAYGSDTPFWNNSDNSDGTYSTRGNYRSAWMTGVSPYTHTNPAFVDDYPVVPRTHRQHRDRTHMDDRRARNRDERRREHDARRSRSPYKRSHDYSEQSHYQVSKLPRTPYW